MEETKIYIAANNSYINIDKFMSIFPSVGEAVMLNKNNIVLRIENVNGSARFEQCVFIWDAKDNILQLNINPEIILPSLDMVNHIVSGEYQKIPAEVYYTIKSKLQQTQIECYYALRDEIEKY